MAKETEPPHTASAEASRGSGAENEPRAGEEFRVRTHKGLPPSEVRELSRLDPFSATRSIVETWGLALSAIAVAVRWPHPLVIAAALVAVAGAQHGLAILAHQSAHYRLYETRWLNDLAGKLCAWPLSVSMLTYRIIHRIHHNHLYEPIDPDLALMAGYPRGRAYLAKKLLKDLFGITTIKNYLYFFGRPPSGNNGKMDDTSNALRAAARRERMLVIALQAALLGASIALGVWRWYLLLWLLPLVTLLQAILRLRAVCEHGAARALSSPLTAARTTIAPAWVRWILYPHHMNYHVEHHLYPSVPHYRLAECHARLQARGLLDGAEVVPTMRGTFRKIFAPPEMRA